ncbi:MAG: PAQR family membrane homeostasis protein TrhA [Paracoccaceae bacterium]
MDRYLARPVGYSRAEYLSDVAVHVIGVVTISAIVPVLVVLAMFLSDSAAVWGTFIYGCTVSAVFVFSAVYNIFPHPKWEWLLKRLDHAAIFLKIAGIYTALSMISGSGGDSVAAIWTVACLGVALKLVSPYRFRWIALSLYVGLGLTVGLLAEGMMSGLPNATFILLALGGVTFLIGVCFYLWQTLPFHFTIWHVFVLAGSLLVYAGILMAVLA